MAKKFSSAEKRHKQSEVRRLRNKSVKSETRTAAKKFTLLAKQKDEAKSLEALKTLIKDLDTAAGKGIIKKNTAARKKSRMQRLFNSLKAPAAAKSAGGR